MEHPNYYAIIPANVRYDKAVSANAKLLYGEITALSNQTGVCWASTSYFENLYGKGRATIQRWLTELESAGYIHREVIYREGTKEIEKRLISIVQQNSYANETTPSLKNETDNNTSINNTMSSCKQHNIPVVKIIQHLNDTTNSKFSAKAEANKKLIRARWNEGNDLQMFLDVIDLKVGDWRDNQKMSIYLRPSTLFSATNFENYKAEVMAKRNKESKRSENDYLKQQEELRRAYEQQ